MKRIFIDCGGNVGQWVKKIRSHKSYRRYRKYIIYSFEPLDFVSKEYRDREDIIFSNKAIWVYDGEIDFYIDRRIQNNPKCCPTGNTIIKKKKTGHLDKEHPIKVPCLDFSKWIIENFDKEDYIILKMDIEGAEYKVLNKMIKHKSIEYINELMIEFHRNKIRLEQKSHDKLMEKLRSYKNLKIKIFKR